MFKRQYDKKLENMQCEIKDLKKDVFEQGEKLKTLQQQNKDLKKEFMELKKSLRPIQLRMKLTTILLQGPRSTQVIIILITKMSWKKKLKEEPM